MPSPPAVAAGGVDDPTYSTDAPAAPYKRTGMTKAKLLARYRSQIQTSKKWRKDEGYEETWKRLIDLYRGKHFTEAQLTEGDKIAINIAFSTVNVIAPSVSVNHPKIDVNPRYEEMSGAADVVEAAANYWWQHYKFQPELRLSVRDFLIIGHGWAKVGYRYVTEDQPVSAQDAQAAVDQTNEQLNASADADPTGASSLLTPDQVQAQAPVTQKVVVEDRPFMERVSPFDMFVDVEAISPDDMRWVAQRIVMPLSDAKANQQYKASARSKLEGDASTNPRWRDGKDSSSSGSTYNDTIERVTVWEFYDIKTGLLCVFAEGGDDFLVEPVQMPYVYGHPFRMLRNYEVPDQFYPIGDLEMIEPIQTELNETRSAMMNHRRRYARKYMVRSESLDDAGLAALRSSQDNQLVMVTDDTPFTDVIAPVEIIPLDSQLYSYSDVIEQDADLVSGVSEYQRGSLSETRRTATEASIIQDSVNARAEDKLALIEGFISAVASAVVQLAQTYLTGESVARFAGPEGMPQWVTFTRDDIQGEFDFEVEGGSTQPNNETQRRQQALQLANVLQPYVNIPGGVNPTALIIHILRDGFGVKNPEEFIIPPAPPPQVDANGQPIVDPNAPPEGAPPGQSGPETGIAGGLTLPESGPNAIPPAVLTQLQNQVGLNLKHP